MRVVELIQASDVEVLEALTRLALRNLPCLGGELSAKLLKAAARLVRDMAPSLDACDDTGIASSLAYLAASGLTLAAASTSSGSVECRLGSSECTCKCSVAAAGGEALARLLDAARSVAANVPRRPQCDVSSEPLASRLEVLRLIYEGLRSACPSAGGEPAVYCHYLYGLLDVLLWYLGVVPKPEAAKPRAEEVLKDIVSEVLVIVERILGRPVDVLLDVEGEEVDVVRQLVEELVAGKASLGPRAALLYAQSRRKAVLLITNAGLLTSERLRELARIAEETKGACVPYAVRRRSDGTLEVQKLVIQPDGSLAPVRIVPSIDALLDEVLRELGLKESSS